MKSRKKETDDWRDAIGPSRYCLYGWVLMDTKREPAGDVPITKMNEDDWMDVAESEFVDVCGSALDDDPAFVFEHPEIGLHGFRWRSTTQTLEAVSFERVGDDEE